MKGAFLFSVDLEDIRLRLDHPGKYQERVPQNTYRYLDWLRRHNSTCTFFVTGDMAVLYPSLIREILSEGHEIACHTFDHIPLDRQTALQFRDDMKRNMDVLYAAGASDIKGFRAPIFSLTPGTQWAYDVLAELGFTYSSSVLPAKNPFYGWENFGSAPRIMNGICEIPLTVAKFGPLTIPVAGGIYFRVLPWFFINREIQKCLENDIPAISYFHPYDIDHDQERYMNPGINNSRIYNFLMYYNRSKLLKKMDKVIEKGFRVMTYSDYLKNILLSDHVIRDQAFVG
ncbi:MAG: polysaccharide deacetylase family protein [Bacteroidota bacterium]